MGTTVSISDELLAAAKRRARERGQSLGSVIEDALRRELATVHDRGPRSRYSTAALDRDPASI